MNRVSCFKMFIVLVSLALVPRVAAACDAYLDLHSGRVLLSGTPDDCPYEHSTNIEDFPISVENFLVYGRNFIGKRVRLNGVFDPQASCRACRNENSFSLRALNDPQKFLNIFTKSSALQYNAGEHISIIVDYDGNRITLVGE